MKQAFELWEEISRDPKKLVEYQMRRKAMLDEFALVKEEELREERARVEGETKGKTEIAKNMLGKGMKLEIIAELTGLPLDELRAIEKQMH